MFHESGFAKTPAIDINIIHSLEMLCQFQDLHRLLPAQLSLIQNPVLLYVLHYCAIDCDRITNAREFPDKIWNP